MPAVFDDVQGAAAQPRNPGLTNLSSTAGQPKDDAPAGGASFDTTEGGVFDKQQPAEKTGAQFDSPVTQEPLTNDQLRAKFEEEDAKNYPQKALDVAKSAASTAGSLAKRFAWDMPAEDVQAAQDAFNQPGTVFDKLDYLGRRALKTWTDAKSDAVRSLSTMAGDVVGKPIESFINDPLSHVAAAAAGPLAPTAYSLIHKATTDKEQRWQEFQQNYFRTLAEQQAAPPAQPGTPEWAATNIEPLSGMAQAVLDKFRGNEVEGLPITKEALSNVMQLVGPEAVMSLSAKAVTAVDSAMRAGKIAEAQQIAGEALAKTGSAVKTAATLPKTVLSKMAEGVLGQGESTEKIADAIEKVSVPLAVATGAAKLPAALKVAEKAGESAEQIGSAISTLARQDPNSIWGKAFAAAKDEDAPSWMKKLFTSPIPGNLAQRGAEATADLAKGAAGGAAFGAGYGAVTEQNPEDLGASIGGGAVLGAGTRLAHLPSLHNDRILERAGEASQELYRQHLEEGVDPASLKKVPSSAWTQAAAIQQGLGVKVRFLNRGEFDNLKTKEGSQMAPAGADGVWDDQSRTIFLNSNARSLAGNLLHEAAHPLFDDMVARHSEISDVVDRSLASKGQTINDMKRTYVEALIRNDLPGLDHQTAERLINNQIDARDAANPGWAYSEVLAENFRNTLKEKQLLRLDPTVSGFLHDTLNRIFNNGAEPTDPATGFFKGYSNVIRSPELTNLGRKLLKNRQEFRPGLDELGGNEGVKLSPEQFGKRREAPLSQQQDGQMGSNSGMVVATPSGNKFRPVSQIRKILRDRVAAVRDLFKSTEKNPKPYGDTSPEVAHRRTTNGVEISGSQLPKDWNRAGAYSKDTENIASVIQDAIDNGKTLGSWYHQIGTSMGKGSWASMVRKQLGAFVAKYHDYQPFGWLADKQGNLHTRVFDRNALNQRLSEWQNRKGILSLEQWGGDKGAALADIKTYLDNHSKGLAGETGLTPEKKNVINAILAGRNAEFEGSNPLRAQLKGKDRQGIVRDFRLDRLETVEPSQQSNITRPDYGKLKGNFTPSEEMDALAKSSPEDYRRFVDAFTGPYGAKQTGWSFHLGSRLTTPDELQRLRGLRTQLLDEAKAAQKKGDMNTAFLNMSKAQAMREAYEAATGVTLEGSRAGLLDYLEKHYPGYKPPVPGGEPAFTGAATPKVDEDYKLKPAGASLVSKAWILPDGKPVQLGSQWHHDWPNNNPKIAKKFGLKTGTTGEENRIDALKKGFVRVNYGARDGLMTIEARESDWPGVRDSVKKMVEANLNDVDHIKVNLFDDKVRTVTDSKTERLFDVPKAERLDKIPFMSPETESELKEEQDMAKAERYFSIGHGNEEEPGKLEGDRLWVYDGSSRAIKDAPGESTHGIQYGHKNIEGQWKGRFDKEKNLVSVVFPERIRNGLEHEPTADDVPAGVYSKLKSKYGNDVSIEAFTPSVDEDEEKSPFYSQLSRVVDSKFSGKEMPAAQLAAILRNPQNGVKAEELKWTGLDDYLKGKGRVTREEVQDYLKQNAVQVKEVIKKVENEPDTNVSPASFSWELKRAGDIRFNRTNNPDEQVIVGRHPEEDGHFVIRKATEDDRVDTPYVLDGDWGDPFEADSIEDAKRIAARYVSQNLENRAEENKSGDTKFSNFQLPSGENYREILFQLPDPATRISSSEYRVEPLTYDDGHTSYFAVTPNSRSHAFKTQAEAEAHLARIPRFEQQADVKSQQFKSSHWDEPNVVAHARVNDRVDSEGKPGLFIEEIQSDWHQKGRKEGYKNSDPIKEKALREEHAKLQQQMTDLNPYDSIDYIKKARKAGLSDDDIAEKMQESRKSPEVKELADKISAVQGALNAMEEGLPDAPFKTTWHEMVFRRMVKQAAEEGKDWVGWTTGEQQAERYDLSKQVDSIRVERDRAGFLITAMKDGREELQKTAKTAQEVEALIGKDLAEKADKQEIGSLQVYEGKDLKVGGEGMKGFYDKMLVDYANKFGKKFGARVEERSVAGEHDASNNEPFEDRKKAVRILDGGGEVYATWKNQAGEELVKNYHHLLELEKEHGNTFAKTYVLGDKQPDNTVHSLPITPEMKESVKGGVQMFTPSTDDEPSSIRRAVEPKKNTPSEPGYVYHATNQDRANDIQSSRYLKIFRPSYGTDQNVWPDGETQKRSYWSPSAGTVWQFAPEEGRAVVLRTKQTTAFKKESTTGDVYARHSVPVSQVEILTDEGWEPLDSKK